MFAPQNTIQAPTSAILRREGKLVVFTDAIALESYRSHVFGFEDKVRYSGTMVEEIDGKTWNRAWVRLW